MISTISLWLWIFENKQIQVPDTDEEIWIELWDTSGEEKFKQLLRAYLRKTDLIILWFDVTDRPGFQKLDEWIQLIDNNINREDVIVFLCAWKIDLTDLRDVSKIEAQKYARDKSMTYLETSAKENKGINEMFNQAAFKLYIKPKDIAEENNVVVLNSSANQNSESWITKSLNSLKSCFGY